MSWRVLDTFLLRRAGFSFDLLAGFADDDLAEHAMDWGRASEEAERMRSAMLGEVFPTAVEHARARGDRRALRGLSVLRSHVGRRRAGPTPDDLGDEVLAKAHAAWRDLMTLTGRLEAEIAAAVEPARRDTARRLRALATRADIADALLQLSPDFHRACERYADPAARAGGAAARAHDRRLYSYLQRLAAKNETTSAFGPVTFGRFAPVESPILGQELSGGVSARVAFVAFWAAAAIGRTATRTAGVRDLVPPRRLPVVHVDGTRALLPGRAPIPLSHEQILVLEACDGTRDATRLSRSTGLDARTVSDALRTLERAALIQRRCEPCSTTLDPLGDVLRQLPDQPDLAGFTAAVRHFEALVSAFAQCPPPERRAGLERAEQAFEALTGVPPRRNAGGVYADRLVLFEDCHGDGQPLLLPDRWRLRVERELAAVLDVGLAIGQHTRAAHRGLAAELLAGQGELPFLDFADRMRAAVADGRLADRLTEADRIRDDYRDLVASASDGAVARLDAGRVADLAQPVDAAAFVSPDLMLSGTGEGQLVLGELHPYVFGWGLQGGFAPDPEALDDELSRLLAVWRGPDRLATVLHRRRHKGLVSNRFPGTFLEVTGSAHTARRRAGIGELRAVLDGGEPVLLGPRGPLELYIGEEDHPHLRVFAPAQPEIPSVTLGNRTPRVVVGSLVVQRARWDLTDEQRADLGAAGSERLPLELARLRYRLDLPRHVFATSPAETKPLYLDLNALFSQHSLGRLARLGGVGLSEMLPAPGQLWLRRSAGAFTSELRLSMLRLPVRVP